MVKGLVEYTHFGSYSAILSCSLFDTIPRYVIILLIVLSMVLAYIIVICFYKIISKAIDVIRFYIEKKFDVLEKFIKEKYKDNDNGSRKHLNTYKDDKKELDKDMSELDMKIIPGKQTITNIVDKIKNLKK